MKSNTGYKGYDRLRQKNANTGEYTGVTKINDPSDPDYVRPVYDPNYCEVGDLYLNVNTNDVYKGSGATSVVINVESNTDWYIVASDPRLSTDLGDEGFGDGTAVVGLDSNTSGDRTLTFSIFTEVGELKQTITIHQEGVAQFELIRLAISYTGNNACSDYKSGFNTTRYADNRNLLDATKLYRNISGTRSAPSGYYSDGFIFRYWNGTQFTNLGICGKALQR